MPTVSDLSQVLLQCRIIILHEGLPCLIACIHFNDDKFISDGIFDQKVFIKEDLTNYS